MAEGCDISPYLDRGLPVVELAGEVDEPPEHDAFAMVVAVPEDGADGVEVRGDTGERAARGGGGARRDPPVRGGRGDGGAPFLLVRNADAGRGWEIPGGKLESGEGYEGAARREFREETGRRLDALEPIAVLEETWVSDAGRDDVVGVAFRGAVGDRVGAPEPKIAEVAWWRSLPEDLTAITFTRGTFERLVALARDAAEP